MNQQIDIVAVAGELAQVQERKSQLEDREKQLKAVLRNLGIGKHPAGSLSVSVSPNRRFDEAKAREFYPQEQWPGFYVVKPDSQIIKQSIPPAVYEQLMSSVGDPKVSVR